MRERQFLQSHRPCWTGTKGKMTTFFNERTVAMDETWAGSYEPNSKPQSNEWKHPGSPRSKKVRPTQSAVIVAYDIDVVILYHAVLDGTEPHHSS